MLLLLKAKAKESTGDRKKKRREMHQAKLPHWPVGLLGSAGTAHTQRT